MGRPMLPKFTENGQPILAATGRNPPVGWSCQAGRDISSLVNLLTCPVRATIICCMRKIPLTLLVTLHSLLLLLPQGWCCILQVGKCCATAVSHKSQVESTSEFPSCCCCSKAPKAESFDGNEDRLADSFPSSSRSFCRCVPQVPHRSSASPQLTLKSSSMVLPPSIPVYASSGSAFLPLWWDRPAPGSSLAIHLLHCLWLC